MTANVSAQETERSHLGMNPDADVDARGSRLVADAVEEARMLRRGEQLSALPRRTDVVRCLRGPQRVNGKRSTDLGQADETSAGLCGPFDRRSAQGEVRRYVRRRAELHDRRDGHRAKRSSATSFPLRTPSNACCSLVHVRASLIHASRSVAHNSRTQTRNARISPFRRCSASQAMNSRPSVFLPVASNASSASNASTTGSSAALKQRQVRRRALCGL